MKNEQDYIRDLTEIRSMMERSSKFLSLSGWAGVMAGIYALAGVFFASNFLHFDAAEIQAPGIRTYDLLQVISVAVVVLALALGTAILLSGRNAASKGERSWNATSRRLLSYTSVPLIAGGILSLIFISKGLIVFVPALTMLFYGLALYIAGNFTFGEIRYLGILQVILGLFAAAFPGNGIWLWAAGFGVLHIVYGIYIHYKYQQ